MLRTRLERSPAIATVLFAMAVSFTTYLCMYAFRRPFTAGTFADLTFLGTGINAKTAYVISQLLGYTVSKYIGVKICSEMTRSRRAAALVLLIAIAQVTLVLFAVLPKDLKALAMFANGLPLGMVWGLVVWYLEGRRASEALLAGLSCSFIVGSGIVKDVGRWVMSDLGASEAWMPAVTGALFLLPYLLSVFLLNQVPEPTAADVAARVQRAPMNASDRWAFVRRFAPGLFMLFLLYFFLTAYRDYRDNYAVEVLGQLGYADVKAIFTKTEMPIAFGVMGTLALLSLVKNNRSGLLVALGIMGFGVALMGGATLLLDAGAISGLLWMILVGMGAYLCYVPYGSVLFDRLMACTGFVGTAVFAIYMADALGYTGSVAVQLYKDLGAGDMSRLGFLRYMTYGVSALGVLMIAGSGVYFGGISRRARDAAPPAGASALGAAQGARP
ncbi:MAG: DUF5690 family protein [Planctomycetota bacterium]|nr:DUF5690 family protein [Planctomycetota bacterium]